MWTPTERYPGRGPHIAVLGPDQPRLPGSHEKMMGILYTLWLFNIAMGNGPFIDGLPIKNGDFPWLC